MHAKILTAFFPSAALILGLGAPAGAFADRSSLQSELLGANENPIVLSEGKGRFRAQAHGGEISFRLSYEGLEDVLQAHIHVANPWDNGPIVVFLCTNIGNTPPGAAARLCPDSSGSVRGTITASDVQAAGPIPSGDLDGLVRLMRDGATYVNVHTESSPSGELRGQTNARRR